MTEAFQKKGRYSSYAPAAELPHPKLAPEVFVILHQVLIRALEILRAEGQPHLVPAMASRAHLHVQNPVAPLLMEGCEPGEHYEGLRFSIHTRPFDWTGGRGTACPITLYHSWHSAR